MIGAQLSSASEADSEFTPNARAKKSKSRKRKIETASSNGPHAEKKLCSETDFGEISKSMENNLAQGLQSLNQVNEQNMQKIAELQRDLHKVTHEKMALNLENTTLMADKIVLEGTHRIETERFDSEKNAFERKLDDAEKAKREAEKGFEDAKKKLMEKITAMEMAQLNEKKSFEDEKVALEQRIAALEMNKYRNTCAHCRNYVDSLTFCNKDCVT